MPLVVDTSSAPRRLSAEELRHWAGTRSGFISSEMRELGAERTAVTKGLRDLGMRVVGFEDLGGRDEDAEQAYLDGVAQADIYVGIVGDRYGTMLPEGWSATHAEYRHAHELGRLVSVWVQADGSQRQGNTRDFVAEIRTFHTTGEFSDPDDLAARVVARMSEIAAEEDSPWVKLDEAIFRAERIVDRGDQVEIRARVRNSQLVRLLEGMRPDVWRTTSTVPIITSDRAGQLNVERVESEADSASQRSLMISGAVSWADGRGDTMAPGTGHYCAEELAELGIRAGLLGEPVPGELANMSFLVDSSDPLEPLIGQALAPAVAEAASRLLIVERLIGSGHASSVDAFELGPVHQGRRRVRLRYTDPRRYSNREPTQRQIEGERGWM